MPDIFISPSSIDTAAESSESSTKKKSSWMHQAFSSYLSHPVGMRFETQSSGETILLLLRRHPITQIEWIITSFILIVIPIFVFSVLEIETLIPPQVQGRFEAFIILTWYLFIFTFSFVNFLLWYFTVSIVTNERIVDIDFDNILHKTFSATTIEKVEDVSMRKGGILRAIFDFGDVHVQTAGSQGEFEFLSVPHPDEVVKVVNDLMDQIGED